MHDLRQTWSFSFSITFSTCPCQTLEITVGVNGKIQRWWHPCAPY